MNTSAPMGAPSRPMELRIAGAGKILAHHVEIPVGLARHLGLMGRPAPAPGYAVWLNPCGGIHTCAVGGPIDLLFLDSGLKVLRICTRVPPWRIRLAPAGTRSVVELSAGSAPADCLYSHLELTSGIGVKCPESTP